MSLQPNLSMYNEQPPAAGAAQLMSLMAGMRQQQLFQAQMQGKMQAGLALAGSYNPDTQDFDVGKLNDALANNPMAAMFGGEAMTQARQMALLNVQKMHQQQQLVSTQLENDQKKYGILGQTVSGLLDDPDLADPQKAGMAVLRAASNLSASDPDNFPLPKMVDFVTRLTHIAPDGTVPDVARLRQDITNFGSQTAQGRDALLAKAPKWDWKDTGNGLVAVDVNPLSPTYGQPQVGSLRKGLTPGEAMTPTPLGVGPGGAPISGTREQFVQQTQPGSQPPGTAPAQSGTPGVQTQWSDTQNQNYKAVNDWANDISTRLNSTNNVLVNLQAAEKAATNALKGGNIGPGTNFYKQIQDMVSASSPERLKALFGTADPKEIESMVNPSDPQSSKEVFDKLNWDRGLNQFVANVVGSAGHFTEKELLESVQHTGNISMRPGAIEDLFNYLTHTADIMRQQQHFAQTYKQYSAQDPLKFDLPKASSDWNSVMQKKGWISYMPWSMVQSLQGQGQGPE